jgi:hypothetical protein
MVLWNIRTVWESHSSLWGRSGRAHSFLAERCSERPGAVKGARFLARRSEPLTARTALAEFPREGMALSPFLAMMSMTT